MRLVLLLCMFLVACGGGGEPVRERPASVQSVEGFSRASTAYVLDCEGVWIPLDVDEPGYIGGCRVKNLYLHSDEPAKWLTFTQRTAYAQVLTQLPNGSAGYALQITHAQGQTLSPFFYTIQGGEPGSHPASLFASRVDIRFTSGGTSQDVTMTGRTWGAAYGSESNNPRIKVTGSGWATLSQTAQQFEAHVGFSDTQNTVAKTPKTYLLARKQFEDVSGARNPISGEYCPSTDKPGVCWFAGPLGTSRSGPLFDGFTANNAFVMGGGLLADGASVPLVDGVLQQEPASTNTVLWNTHEDVGVAVADGASENYVQSAAAFAGSNRVLVDPRSGRAVYGVTDLTFSGDTITSKKTDLSVFRVGHAVWAFVLTKGRSEVVTVLESSPRLLRVSAPLAAASGLKASLHRVPAVGDHIMIKRNNGAMHYSTVSDVQLPSLSASTAIDGYQHQSLVVTLADAFPSDGVNVGHKGNENQPVYYGKDLVYDMAAVRAAGLGYVSRNGLVQQVNGSHDFGGTGYTGSAWVKGSGSVCVGPDCTPFNTSSYQRVTAAGVGALSVIGSALVAVPQLESLPYASSPIVTMGGPATRAATFINTGSN